MNKIYAQTSNHDGWFKKSGKWNMFSFTLILFLKYIIFINPVHAQQAYSLNQWDSEVIPNVNTSILGIAHNGTDTWMAINDNQVFTSSDGSTWTAITSNYATVGIQIPQNLTYDNGRWKISDLSNGIVWSNDNGATWTTTASPPSELDVQNFQFFNSYASRGNVWIGTPYVTDFNTLFGDPITGKALFITTDNGANWTMKPIGNSDWSGAALTNGVYTSFTSLAYGLNDRVVAVGDEIAYSDNDGDTWVVVNKPTNEQLTQLSTDGNGNWVAAGTQSVAYSSNNGLTWQLGTISISGDANLTALSYGLNFEGNPTWSVITANSQFGGMQIRYSEDGGATWNTGQFSTPASVNFPSGTQQAAYGPEGFRFVFGDLLIYPRIIQIPAVIELVDPNFDNQIVSPGQNINLPFRVKDTEGEIIQQQSDIVYEVLSGGGSVSPAGPMTTTNGTASTNWTVGTTFGVNELKASIQGESVETIVTATVVYPAPTNLFPMPGTDDVEIFFEQEFASNITNYEYQLDDGTWQAISPADGTSPITISGLTQGTEVGIRLRATDGSISGLESAQIFITPGAPSAPTGLSASGIGEAVIAFTEPEIGAPFTNYEYSLDGGAWQAFSPAVTTSPVTISPLTNDQQYSIRLRAVNSAGAGAASQPVTAIPGTFVPNITLSPETNAFKVTITNWQDFLNSDPGIDDPNTQPAIQTAVQINLTLNGVTTSHQTIFAPWAGELYNGTAGEFIFPTNSGYASWDPSPSVVGGQEYQVSLQLAYQDFQNPLSPLSNTVSITPNSPPPAATPVISAVSSNAGGGVSITIENTDDYESLSSGRWNVQVSIDGGNTFIPDVINIWAFAFPSTYPTFAFPPQGGDPLINDQAYDVVIKLIDTYNQIGTSGPSNQVTVTPQAPTPPPTPVITSVVPGDQTLTLQIDIPAGSVWDRLQYKTTNGNWETVQVNPSLTFGPKTEAYTGTAIIEYDTSFEPFRVCMDGDGNVLDGVDISFCSFDEDDNSTGNSVGFNPAAKLVNGTLYGVTLRTFSFETGLQGVSEEVSGTPEAPTAPETPTISNVIPGDQTLTLEFNIPAGSAWDRIEYKTSNGTYISGVIDPVANGLVTEAYTGTITIDTDTSQDFQCNQNGTIINWVGVDFSTFTVYTGFGSDPTDAGLPQGLDRYLLIDESSICEDSSIGGQWELAGLVNGTAYNVKIRAFNSFNTLFAESNEVSGTPNLPVIELTISDPILTKTKDYDGTTSADVTAGALSGVATGEDVTVAAVATYDDETVGTGKTITVVYTLSGADAANYTTPADFVVTDGEITTKSLTIADPTLTKTKTYDGTTSADVTAGALSGVATGEDVTVTAVATYDDETVGTGKTITVVYTL
ncbi:YDG domain-containing protein, partial [Belliella aquatica]